MYARQCLFKKPLALFSYLSHCYYPPKSQLHLLPRIRQCRPTDFTRIPSISFRFKHDGGDKDKENILHMSNSQYLDYMYKAWLNDPQSVSASWDSYFKLIHEGLGSKKSPTTESEAKSASIASVPVITPPPGGTPALPPPQESPATTKEIATVKSATDLQGEKLINGALDIVSTIRAYQARGHLIADVDPLGIQNPESSKLQETANLPPAVVVRKHLTGMKETDMNKEFPLPASTSIAGKQKSLPLKEILLRLNKIYCGHLGLEYMHISDIVMLDWLREKFEVPGAWELPPELRKFVWMDIMRAVTFESFLARRYATEKRFGLEGCEAFIPAMIQVLETSAEHGVESVVVGMAHRGRLSTLVNVCSKPMNQLFTQFNPITLEGLGSGDVKYHLGTLSEKILERSQKKITVTIMANSSHLEAIDPVIVGRVRAEQVETKDTRGEKSLPVLVHGDAAFAGQGVVYETMHLTHLPEYTTRGVVHIIINNQIGFTTDPRYSRSSEHCTDVAKVVNAPIFHVHADDPDLVAYCSKVASEYRATFHNDVVLDIVGYRRNGHNELDEPMLTQPLMYKRIRQHPNVLKIYTSRLLKDGVITESFAREQTEKYVQHCEEEFDKAQTISSMQATDWTDVPWTNFYRNQSPANEIPPTGIDKDTLLTICNHVATIPREINVHQQVARLMDRRMKLIHAQQTDWAMGECLAFASLLKDGHHVRLSGQDVERGTFSHRMHIIHDQTEDMKYRNILHDIFPDQALYTVSNSSLSEFGVSGFELGYSTYNHNTLTIWESQFGDFCNTAQVIQDNLLCSGQVKWGRQVGLVLLLPHGLDGQGPEHSSARVERFLQLCDDDYTHVPGGVYEATTDESIDHAMTHQLFDINWIICNLTTPANLFHALRRQILMPFRKPLVIMSPKSLLRHPMAQSGFEEYYLGTRFQTILPDTVPKPDQVEKIILCTGKVFYDLVTERKDRQLDDKIAIIRVEQLCPFPYHAVAREVRKYPKSKVMWFQEEHKNQGPYHYVRDRIALALGIPLEAVTYGGRSASAAPCAGSKAVYQKEYDDMILTAMNLS